MCGIIGYVGQDPCTDVLLDALSRLEYRGYDSAGIAVFENGTIRVEKAAGRLDNLRALLAETGAPAGHCGIGHTRWATHGVPNRANAHPHAGRRVTLVHNGILENDRALRAALEAQGHRFVSETDTEAAVRLLDACYDGDPLAALARALPQLRGSYAFAILFDGFPDRLFAVCRESPLIVGLGGARGNYVASDIPAFLSRTNRYFALEPGEVAIVRADGVSVVTLDGRPVRKQPQVADWDIGAAEKGGFAHFMCKEIFEQPEALARTLSPRIRGDAVQLEPGLEAALGAARRLQIVGCGTAMHAGMVGKRLVETLARVPAEVSIASEFRYAEPVFGAGDLAVIVSQSGETADSLAALRLAKANGVPVLAIVNVVGSTIAREADHVLYTWAGPEIAVASTKAYLVQLAAFYLLAFQMAFARGRMVAADYAAGLRELRALPEKLTLLLGQSDAIAALAAGYARAEHLFYLGRGLDYALSLEGSLKLKEVSYLFSEAYAAGELKHGTISLIEAGTPVVALATQRRLLEKTVGNIREVRARGARVLLICAADAEIDPGLADDVIRLPACDDRFAPLLGVVPLQLFAYHVACLRGCDVDRPRNLAKSVTVE